MSREHLRLVVSGGEPVAPAPEPIPLRNVVSQRSAPRLACIDCGGRVMAAWSGGFVVILTDHRCPLPRSAAARAWAWLGRPDVFVLAWIGAALVLAAVTLATGGR